MVVGLPEQLILKDVSGKPSNKEIQAALDKVLAGETDPGDVAEADEPQAGAAGPVPGDDSDEDVDEKLGSSSSSLSDSAGAKPGPSGVRKSTPAGQASPKQRLTPVSPGAKSRAGAAFPKESEAATQPEEPMFVVPKATKTDKGKDEAPKSEVPKEKKDKASKRKAAEEGADKKKEKKKEKKDSKNKGKGAKEQRSWDCIFLGRLRPV